MTSHPGKSSAQRRVLDEIGSGNPSPVADKRTFEALLRSGLIVEMSPDEIPVFGSICMKVRRFDMPIPVHTQWCEYWSEQPCEEDEWIEQLASGMETRRAETGNTDSVAKP